MFKLIVAAITSGLLVVATLLVPTLDASNGGTITIESDDSGNQSCVIDGVETDCEQALKFEEVRAGSQQEETVIASGVDEDINTK